MSVSELVRHVLDPDLCTGCGACGLVCPEQLITFDPDTVKPRVAFDPAICGSCSACFDVCPGQDPETPQAERELFGRQRTSEERWLGIWRDVKAARSRDRDIVDRSASGGTVTTLLLASMDLLDVRHVLTMGRRQEVGWRARGTVSDEREIVANNAQSTYQLAPYLAELRSVFETDPGSNIAVAGVACHMQAIRKMQRMSGAIGIWARERIVFLVEIACSSSTLPAGTSQIIEQDLRLQPDQVSDVRYRHGPYPGRFRATTRSGDGGELEFWEILSKLKNNKTHRCLSCGDWMSGLADVSVCDGDPNIFDASLNGSDVGKHGRVLLRTAAGAELFGWCVAEGRIEAWDTDLSGFNLGLARKRSRRLHYEAQGGPFPAGPGVADCTSGTAVLSDDQLIDPKQYSRITKP